MFLFLPRFSKFGDSKFDGYLPLFCNMQNNDSKTKHGGMQDQQQQTSLIPRPQLQEEELQEEEQQEQVSSAGYFGRSSISFFFSFPYQKQLGPESSLHLRDLSVFTESDNSKVYEPVRLSKPQSDCNIFLLFLRIITFSGDLQITTFFFRNNYFLPLCSLLAVSCRCKALECNQLPILCSSLTSHSQVLCSTSLPLKSPQITKTMMIFIP